MPAEQERLLTEAGFCWDPATEAWHARYQEAAAWKHEHGSLDFPRKHPLEDMAPPAADAPRGQAGSRPTGPPSCTN